MRWLEEIRVRTHPRKEEEVLAVLLETADSLAQNNQLREVRIYAHYFPPAGFSLVLVWETPSIPREGSETAALILEGIRTLGLHDHTVMVERRKKVKFKKVQRTNKPGGVE